LEIDVTLNLAGVDEDRHQKTDLGRRVLGEPIDAKLLYLFRQG